MPRAVVRESLALGGRDEPGEYHARTKPISHEGAESCTDTLPEGTPAPTADCDDSPTALPAVYARDMGSVEAEALCLPRKELDGVDPVMTRPQRFRRKAEEVKG